MLQYFGREEHVSQSPVLMRQPNMLIDGDRKGGYDVGLLVHPISEAYICVVCHRIPRSAFTICAGLRRLHSALRCYDGGNVTCRRARVLRRLRGCGTAEGRVSELRIALLGGPAHQRRRALRHCLGASTVPVRAQALGAHARRVPLGRVVGRGRCALGELPVRALRRLRVRYRTRRRGRAP